MSIELALLRTVESLVQKRITRLERRISYLHLSPALLKDIGLEGALLIKSKVGYSLPNPPGGLS